MNDNTPKSAEPTIAHILSNGKLEYLEYDFGARLARRRGKPFDVSVAEKNLLLLKSIFDRHGLTFWLVYGTCLGAVRGGSFIAHDTDTDIAMFQHERDKLIAALPDLISEGLVPVRTKHPDDLLTLMRDDEYIDIGIFGQRRDQDGFEYWCYQDNRVYGDHFGAFEKTTFLGQTFLVPQRVEVFLSSLYGSNWKAPVKNLPAKVPKSRREFNGFSDLLDLAEFFRGMPEHVVLKLPAHFPSYYDYSDIDILCADREAVLTHIQQVGRKYESHGFTIKREEHDGHLHLDFYAPGAKLLNFRFDLLDLLSGYRKLTVASEFAPAILESRVKQTQRGAEVQVPAPTHDLAVRFLEFVEWKDERPDKVKHWEFIEKTGNFDFVEVVRRFTDLDLQLTRKDGFVNLTWSRRLKLAPQAEGALQEEVATDSRLDALLAQAAQDFADERFVEAAEQLCGAIAIDPNQTSALMRLGECLAHLHDNASAHWCFNRVTRLDPANTKAAQALGRIAAIHDAQLVACGRPGASAA